MNKFKTNFSQNSPKRIARSLATMKMVIIVACTLLLCSVLSLSGCAESFQDFPTMDIDERAVLLNPEDNIMSSGPIQPAGGLIPSLFNSVSPNYLGSIRFQLMAAAGTYNTTTERFSVQGPNAYAGELGGLVNPGTSLAAQIREVMQGTFFVGVMGSRQVFELNADGLTSLTHQLLPGMALEITLQSAIRWVQYRPSSKRITFFDTAPTSVGTGSVNVLKDVKNGPAFFDAGAANDVQLFPNAFGLKTGPETIQLSPAYNAGVVDTLSFYGGESPQAPVGFSIQNSAATQTFTFTQNTKGVEFNMPIRFTDVTIRCFSYGTGYYSSAGGLVGPAIYAIVPVRSGIDNTTAPNLPYAFQDVLVDSRYLWNEFSPTEPTVVIPTNRVDIPPVLDNGTDLHTYLNSIGGTGIHGLPNVVADDHFVDRFAAFLGSFDALMP